MSIRSKLVLAPLAFLFASCNVTWQGQSAGVSPEAAERGIKDVAYLSRQYETESYFRRMRQRFDGLSNAFNRDLSHMTDTIDRHFFNYTISDPYVNYQSPLSPGDHLGRGFIAPFSSLGMALPR
jgi:hypothetical protein